MTWTVVWKKSAENHLGNLWLNAPDQQALTDAANLIDRLLKYFPETVGESRAGDRRIFIEPPLAVMYKVNPMDRMVNVLAVWRI